MCADPQAANSAEAEIVPSGEREIRKLQKLLQQIEKLAARSNEGQELQREERDKLARLDSVQMRLRELMSHVHTSSTHDEEPKRLEARQAEAIEHSCQLSLGDVPTPARCRLSSRSWYEDAVNIEDVQPADTALSVAPVIDADSHVPVVIADVKPHVKEVHDDAAMQVLLKQVRVLSKDCFLEDCLEGCSKRGGWRITILASGMDRVDTATLLGFIVFRLKTVVGCLSIAKLAVPESYRKRGYGRQLVQWSIDWAKTQPEIKSVALASLAGAVTFYQRLGFKRLHEITPKDKTDDDDPFFPGQMYMECRIRKGGRRYGR